MTSAWCSPYWGPYYGGRGWGYSSIDINSHSAYRNWNGGVTRTTRHAEWDYGEGGNWKRGVVIQPLLRPRERRRVQGVGRGRRRLQRPPRRRQLRPAHRHGPRRGRSSPPATSTTATTTARPAASRTTPRTDTGVARKGNNVYAGSDGNVYRYNQDNGWQQKTNNGWQDAQKNGQFQQQRSDLKAQAQSRDSASNAPTTTALQQRQPRRSAPTPSGARGGGGRGGGGRR